MKSFLKAFFVASAVIYSSISAHSSNIEGKWFLHKFGELRAYHGDFLNVCSGSEFRTCRTVQYGFNKNDSDTFFGNTRLSIARTLGGGSTATSGPPQYTIEFFIRDLPDEPNGPFILSIDGEIFQLQNKDWKSGSPEGYNVAETFSIINPNLIDELIAAMRKGNSVRVLYDGWKETRFQLRGLKKALDAIEMQIKLPSS